MLAKIANRMVTHMIENEVIEAEKAPLYVFGMEQGMRTLLETLLALMTGLIMGVFWQSIVILAAFMPVRIYAGGYHAKTPLRCALISWLMFTAMLFWLCYGQESAGLQSLLLLAVTVLIAVFSPVQDEHKPLQEYEIKKYRKKAFGFLGADIVVFAVGHVAGVSVVSRCVVRGLAMLLLILTAGIMKNAVHERREKYTKANLK